MGSEMNIEQRVAILQQKIKGIPEDQIMRELNNCGADFTDLYEQLERYGKAVIANYIIKNRSQGFIHKDDVWQNFSIKRLPKAIADFNCFSGVKFTSYLHNSIKQQLIDDLRKVSRKEGKDDKFDEFEEVLGGLKKIFHVSGERKIALLDFLKAFFHLLNNLNTDILKILVFHCRKLLDEGFTFDCANDLLEKWNDSTLEVVTEDSEKAYTKTLELEKSEDFLMRIQQRLHEEGRTKELFKTPQNTLVNEWVRQIKDLLKKQSGKMSELKAELLECIS